MSEQIGEGGRGNEEFDVYDAWSARVAIWVCNGSSCAAVGWAVYALFWGAGWLPFWAFAATWSGLLFALNVPIWRLKIEGRRLRRSAEESRKETIQLQILRSHKEAELAAMRAQGEALRAQGLELERMLLQRQIEQEAREIRSRLDIACAVIEADRLEAAAWRMELTVKQLELKLNQADLFESLSAIEDNAQDRIIAAYEQGIDHGKRGIVIPAAHMRHLRVVEESA